MENSNNCSENNLKLLKNVTVKLEEFSLSNLYNNNNNNNNNNTYSEKMLEKENQQQLEYQKEQLTEEQIHEKQQQLIYKEENATKSNENCGSRCEGSDESVGGSCNIDDRGDASGNCEEGNFAMACAARVEDEGGGFKESYMNAIAEGHDFKQNGTDLITSSIYKKNYHTQTISDMPEINSASHLDCGMDYDENAGAIGAMSLTPPVGNSHSNRTSINNSTENLSYSSENYYPDDLILLDDDDVDAEEILSLNSDDCVYAYRGDGTEFDLNMQAMAARGGVASGAMNNIPDGGDETDFLEMDFEPDPPSELEYGIGQTSCSKDPYLLQREDMHRMSGRHSANFPPVQNSSLHQQRQLFSSPIDDDLLRTTPVKYGLQSQSLSLSKNFARITMHLDQIKSESPDRDELIYDDRDKNDRSLSGSSRERLDLSMSTTETAHSLPNTLHVDFVRHDTMQELQSEKKTSPSKITGAKPKRLSSTHSTSSSQSSKNSSTSRKSLRSSFNQCGSKSNNSTLYDERSVSCTEFRALPTLSATAGCLTSLSVDANDCRGHGIGPSSMNLMPGTPIISAHNIEDMNALDDGGCLDCLENEFLASTIGKIMDPNGCPKCRRQRLRNPPETQYLFQTRNDFIKQRPTKYFLDAMTENEQLFEHVTNQQAQHDFQLCGNNTVNDMQTICVKKPKEFGLSKKVVHDKSSNCGTGSGSGFGGSDIDSRSTAGQLKDETVDFSDDKRLSESEYYSALNQRMRNCDTYNDDVLQQSLLLTEPEIATISTANVNEETLVQALDNFHITYNSELLRKHFHSYYATVNNNNNTNINNNNNNTNYNSNYNMQKPVKDFKNLKHFILYESKKYNNYPRLKRLIEIATSGQVNVDFQRDTSLTTMEMQTVKVNDIIEQWSKNSNLEVLKELDKRFAHTNVLGKIINIIRLAQQRSSPRRPLPEFISIPQYYPSGFLTLTKKC